MPQNIKPPVFYLFLSLSLFLLSGCLHFFKHNPLAHDVLNNERPSCSKTPETPKSDQSQDLYNIYALGPMENSENIYLSNNGHDWRRTQGIGHSISSGRPNPNFNYWIVGTEGTLWRLVDNRWVNFNLENNGVFKKAYDVGAGHDGQVYAVGDNSMGSNGLEQNLYRLENGEWISIQGLGSRVDVDVNGVAWTIGGAPNYGAVYELVEGRGWVLHGGISDAVDLGCGLHTYVVTSAGSLKAYKNGEWVNVQSFNGLDVQASRVDCAPDGSIIVADVDGYIHISNFGTEPFVRASINSVSDVSFAKE